MGDHDVRPLALALIGELGADAIRRELWEELGAEIEIKARVATLENVFTWEGNVCHEIALVYECTLKDTVFHSRGEWEAHEETPGRRITHKIAWKRIDAFGAGGDILYPEALATLLRG